MNIIAKDACPIPIVYGKSNTCSILGPDNKPIGWILHDYRMGPNGIQIRSTFRFPAKTPKDFLKAMRNHNIEEMGQLPKFVPELFRANIAIT